MNEIDYYSIYQGSKVAIDAGMPTVLLTQNKNMRYPDDFPIGEKIREYKSGVCVYSACPKKIVTYIKGML